MITITVAGDQSLLNTADGAENAGPEMKYLKNNGSFLEKEVRAVCRFNA